MTINEFLDQLTQQRYDDKAEYQIVIPMERGSDIDETEMADVTSLIWDIAEKRLILDW